MESMQHAHSIRSIFEAQRIESGRKLHMKTLNANDVAIALAIRQGTLRVDQREGPFGPYWSIQDDHGVIEVALSAEDAEQIVAAVSEAMAE